MTAPYEGAPRVLVCGDTHGDTGWVTALIEVAERNACSRILICGDFGYWTHRADGCRYLAELDAALGGSTVQEIVFVDGNHEYHSTHPAKPPHHRKGLQEMQLHIHPDGTGFAHVADTIRYAGRGARWQWGATRFGALGGAASTDRQHRKRYRDWWVEETPTRHDLDRLGNNPLDVLICHDAPGDHLIEDRADRVDDPRSARVRALLTDAVAATGPQLVFHGHWHRRYDTTITVTRPDGAPHTVRVCGLAANVDPDDDEQPGVLGDAAVVYDTATMTVHPAITDPA